MDYCQSRKNRNCNSNKNKEVARTSKINLEKKKNNRMKTIKFNLNIVFFLHKSLILLLLNHPYSAKFHILLLKDI